MIDLAQKLETVLSDVVFEQQAKAERALQSLKEVNKFLTHYFDDGFDLEALENQIDGIHPSAFMEEAETISKIFPTIEEI